jgi:hypothetical protein
MSNTITGRAPASVRFFAPATMAGEAERDGEDRGGAKAEKKKCETGDRKPGSQGRPMLRRTPGGTFGGCGGND